MKKKNLKTFLAEVLQMRQRQQRKSVVENDHDEFSDSDSHSGSDLEVLNPINSSKKKRHDDSLSTSISSTDESDSDLSSSLSSQENDERNQYEEKEYNTESNNIETQSDSQSESERNIMSDNDNLNEFTENEYMAKPSKDSDNEDEEPVKHTFTYENNKAYQNILTAIAENDKDYIKFQLKGYAMYDRLIIFEKVGPQILTDCLEPRNCLNDYTIWYRYQIPYLYTDVEISQLLHHIATTNEKKMCHDIWKFLQKRHLPTKPEEFKYALQSETRYNHILRGFNDTMKKNPNWNNVKEILLRCNMATDLTDKIKELKKDYEEMSEEAKWEKHRKRDTFHDEGDKEYDADEDDGKNGDKNHLQQNLSEIINKYQDLDVDPNFSAYESGHESDLYNPPEQEQDDAELLDYYEWKVFYYKKKLNENQPYMDLKKEEYVALNRKINCLNKKIQNIDQTKQNHKIKKKMSNLTNKIHKNYLENKNENDLLKNEIQQLQQEIQQLQQEKQQEIQQLHEENQQQIQQLQQQIHQLQQENHIRNKKQSQQQSQLHKENQELYSNLENMQKQFDKHQTLLQHLIRYSGIKVSVNNHNLHMQLPMNTDQNLNQPYSNRWHHNKTPPNQSSHQRNTISGHKRKFDSNSKYDRENKAPTSKGPPKKKFKHSKVRQIVSLFLFYSYEKNIFTVL